ncbi:WD repeat-containing protein 53 [Scleropages formosus]|uniref:WD repeat domain 53 n=1 Tax=Scleropages formosus TaxID=113540 RepID=A0A8C9T8C3_SCLFO|nr:WD repeat-containing protein 53 [Scleropages formosus]XP_029111509.1 WD repeat-containing protein 53 [Scleropages formosus]
MARQWSGGHSAAVLCVGVSGDPGGPLASGGEAGEVALWAPDGTPLGTARLRGGEDVTCAVFSPVSPNALYVSHGEAVSALDPRSLKGPAEELRVGADEINWLSPNETGALMAAADDSGAVRVVELASGKVTRTLRRHTNICSSVAFRPRRPHSLVSAGLDMQVMLWSLQKARPLWTANLQDFAEEEEEEGSVQSSGQLLNPPLAHCVSVATCGNVVACGAEDGRVHLLQVGAGSRVERHVSLRTHSQGVSQTHFLSFLSHPYWLATGGNDSQVALWDVSWALGSTGGESKGGEAAPSRRHRGKRPVKPKAQVPADKLGQGVEEGASAAETGHTLSPGKDTGPRLRFSHGDKVNWLCPALLKGEPCLLVADQGSAITVYSLSGISHKDSGSQPF